MLRTCPGSIAVKQPKPQPFRCKNCGSEVEIWSDEATQPCPKCGKDVFREGMQSCIDWCKFAKECVGEEKYKKYGEMKSNLRKQALVEAMEKYFERDTKRIDHAHAVIARAEEILKDTTKADPNIVIAAAVFHDIGIKNAELKYGSSAAEYQEIEGPPVTREILAALGYEESFIKEVCDIVGHHHHPRDEESVNFDVLYDADMLVNLAESQESRGVGKILSYLRHATFRTSAGRQIAFDRGLIGAETGDDAK